ncbi:MAG: peptidase S41, partial [Alloprevotella sp.]|nr:peptidase S41 [Alloprevotella sp.]
MQKNNKYSYVPFYVSLGVVLGILIGSFYANQYSQKFLSIIDGSGNKLSDLLYIIEDQYVDPVQMNEIVEKAL